VLATVTTRPVASIDAPVCAIGGTTLMFTEVAAPTASVLAADVLNVVVKYVCVVGLNAGCVPEGLAA